MSKKIHVTDTILRDAHQSLLATRMRTEDMLPICDKLDKVGYWSLEVWGGATFDACVRFLKEDPWERLRKLRAALPNTRLQMLLRGQNLLGYRHYSDDVVKAFVAKAAVNGIDVFRIFDAMNDVRNLRVAIEAVKAAGKHAQGTIAYTTSPVHTIDAFVNQAKTMAAMGVAFVDIIHIVQHLAMRGLDMVILVKGLQRGFPVAGQDGRFAPMITQATKIKWVQDGLCRRQPFLQRRAVRIHVNINPTAPNLRLYGLQRNVLIT